MALRLLRDHEAELKRLGVVRLFLFGSTAQDQARDGSDMGGSGGSSPSWPAATQPCRMAGYLTGLRIGWGLHLLCSCEPGATASRRFAGWFSSRSSHNKRR
jgi:hypothetical protein